MNALDLLRAVRRELPDLRPSLTLSPELRLVVGLCERPAGAGAAPRFLDATLDAADLAKDPAEIAAEIAEGWRRYAASGFRLAAPSTSCPSCFHPLDGEAGILCGRQGDHPAAGAGVAPEGGS